MKYIEWPFAIGCLVWCAVAFVVGILTWLGFFWVLSWLLF